MDLLSFGQDQPKFQYKCIKYIQRANEPTTPYQVFQFITDTLLRSAKSNLIPEKKHQTFELLIQKYIGSEFINIWLFVIKPF